MRINGEYVMTLNAGANMEKVLRKLVNSKGFTSRSNFIFVGKADLRGIGMYSYISGTKEMLNIDNIDRFSEFKEFDYVGYCGNENVYLYK